MTLTDPIYAVGDVHGHLDKLDRALALIEADGGQGAEIVFVGDYVDRGPDSRGVIERLLAGQQSGRPWHLLKGNHDRLFQHYIETGTDNDPAMPSGLSWLNPRLGAMDTLASYGVQAVPEFEQTPVGVETAIHFTRGDRILERSEVLAEARAAVPPQHLAFLRSLALFHRHGDLFFCHAGVRPGIPLDRQTEDDLIWIRRPFNDDTTDHGPLIIHGHTPVDQPTHFGNRIDIDSGAAFGRPLVPIVLEGRSAWTLDGSGRTPLTPSG